ncbi:hypothetical protein QW180_12270 [Vibrio sinaloensis]|nr:hypothetical protein [Vibrio sinaloensis]
MPARATESNFIFFLGNALTKKASEGEYVATAVWMYAEERMEHFYYSAPVAQEQFVFFHLKEKAVSLALAKRYSR